MIMDTVIQFVFYLTIVPALIRCQQINWNPNDLQNLMLNPYYASVDANLQYPQPNTKYDSTYRGPYQRNTPESHVKDDHIQTEAQDKNSPPQIQQPTDSTSPKFNAHPNDLNEGYDTKNQALQKLVQQLYMAQAQVQLEATEIQKAQSLAGTATQNLEEATNNVKIITVTLHQSQQTVAQAALRAQNAQLQLAAHDQLLFAARQKVDALSAQMVGLQAQLGIGENKIAINVAELMNQLNQPLKDEEKPKPIPSLVAASGNEGNIKQNSENSLSARQRRYLKTAIGKGKIAADRTCLGQNAENQKYIESFLADENSSGTIVDSLEHGLEY